MIFFISVLINADDLCQTRIIRTVVQTPYFWQILRYTHGLDIKSYPIRVPCLCLKIRCWTRRRPKRRYFRWFLGKMNEVVLVVLQVSFYRKARKLRLFGKASIILVWHIPWGYSSVGRAPALQAGGQRFESAYLHQYGIVAQLVRARAW